MKKIVIVLSSLLSFIAFSQENLDLIKCEKEGVVEYRMPLGKNKDKGCSKISVWLEGDNNIANVNVGSSVSLGDNNIANIGNKTTTNNANKSNFSFSNDLYKKRIEILEKELLQEEKKLIKLKEKQQTLPKQEYSTALAIIEQNISSLKKELNKTNNNSINISVSPEKLPTTLPKY